jgi:hypothetical protein
VTSVRTRSKRDRRRVRRRLALHPRWTLIRHAPSDELASGRRWRELWMNVGLAYSEQRQMRKRCAQRRIALLAMR